MIDNMQRDYRLITEKSEMVTVAELSKAKGEHLMKLLDTFKEKAIKAHEGDFFILVRRHHEVTDRLMDRIKIKQSLALPTSKPGWSYWKYDSSKGELELICDIPNKDTCEWALKHKYEVGLQKPIAMKTILDYYDGTLLKKFNDTNMQIAQKGIE